MSVGSNPLESRLETPLGWRQREIAITPLLLGGLDEPGRILAERFMAMLRLCPNVGGQIQLFDPLQTPSEPAPDPLNRLLQQSRSEGQPVEIQLALLASWQIAAAQSDVLDRLDRSLTAIEPGKPMLTLIVLLPLPADHAVHAQACEALMQLDRLAAKLRSPARILVFETTVPTAEDTGGELMEALFRALVDAEISELLHDHTRPPRERTAGKPLPCATLKVQRLLNHQAALLERLEARFQQDLFWRGLMHPNRLSASRRNALQTRAHEFLRDCAGHFAEQYHRFPEVVANLPATAPTAAEMQQIQALFEAEFAAAERQVEARLTSFFTVLEQRLRAEFAVVLEDDSAYLSAGRYYLEALATGLQDIREEFCHKPLQTGVSAYYEARLEKLIGSFRLPVAGAGQSPVTTVRTTMKTLRNAVADSAAVEHIPARFLVLSWDRIDAYLQQGAATVAAAQRLLAASCALFLAEVAPLAQQLQAIRQRREALLSQHASPNLHQSRFKRLLQRSRNDREQRSLQDSLIELERQQALLQGIYANLYRFYLGLIGELLWPQVVRVLLVEGSSRHLKTLTLEFTAFWAGVGAACTERLRDADSGLADTGPSTIPIVSRTQFDILYDAAASATDWGEYAAQSLRFEPGALAPSALQSPHSPTLWEHFQAGPAQLLQRLTEFTAIRFTRLSTRDALELLELNGTGPARELLQQALTRAQFRPAMTALPARFTPLRCIDVLRSTPRILEALERRYGDLFGPDTYYLEHDDPHVIDLTVLTTGLSAALLAATADEGTVPVD